MKSGATILTGGKSSRPGFFYAAHGDDRHCEGFAGLCRGVFWARGKLFRVKLRRRDPRRQRHPLRAGRERVDNEDKEREQLISDIESGMVFVNKMVASDPRLPFGGMKWSGTGARWASTESAITDIKTVWIQ